MILYIRFFSREFLIFLLVVTPTGICLLKVVMETLEQCVIFIQSLQWRQQYNVIDDVINFGRISHIVPVFLLIIGTPPPLLTKGG